jgi:uncharacterized membrane protein YfcA
VSTVLVLALGALCGGFVTGLAGFGTGLTALGLWLHVVSPAAAAALVVVCSVAGQIQSLYTVRRAIAWRRAWLPAEVLRAGSGSRTASRSDSPPASTAAATTG